MEENSDPLTEQVLKSPTGVRIGMMLVGAIAAGVLASQQRRRRLRNGAVRG
jgi:hypothetical protein